MRLDSGESGLLLGQGIYTSYVHFAMFGRPGVPLQFSTPTRLSGALQGSRELLQEQTLLYSCTYSMPGGFDIAEVCHVYDSYLGSHPTTNL